MSSIRRHLTYANVISTLCLILLLGGGSALASFVITSNSQVAKDTISGHRPSNGEHANIIAGSISGTDIADRSGVDTCKTPLTKKFGPICAGSDGVSRTWIAAMTYCGQHGLRLPTPGEAVALAKNYAVPGLGTGEVFWTDDEYLYNSIWYTVVMRQNGFDAAYPQNDSEMTVCVTDPSA